MDGNVMKNLEFFYNEYNFIVRIEGVMMIL